MEQAGFLITDPLCVVRATLACPLCLHAVDWRQAGFGARPAIECTCRSCGDQRTVELSGPQLLRLIATQDGEDGALPAPGLAAPWPPPYQ